MFCHKEPKIATAMGISKDPEKRKRQLENLAKGKRFLKGDERTRKANAASIESYREHKTQREILLAWMNQETKGEDGKLIESRFFPGKGMKNAELISSKKIQLAKEGNLEAIKYLEKQIGEAPSDEVNVNLSGGMSVQQDYNFFNIDDFADEGE